MRLLVALLFLMLGVAFPLLLNGRAFTNGLFGIVFFALFFCMIGPGCDDYGGTAAIPAAMIGALIGRLCFGRRKPAGWIEICPRKNSGQPGGTS
ncbi:MAG: hypothetical protein ACP5XB_28025 [Isosphaeraceae bacterium]